MDKIKANHQSMSIIAREKKSLNARLKRRIGVFDEGVEGPLIIAIACLHGNEFLPYRAIDYIVKMLEVEHVTNPGFVYKGRFVGLSGNLAATKAHQRYIDKDLNRIWSEALIASLADPSYMPVSHEEKEMQAIWRNLLQEVSRYKGEQVIILDFHTTSSPGGIFCLPSDDPHSLELAFDLFIPVVEGLKDSVQDSFLSFLTEAHLGKPTIAMSVEVGQHEDPNSIYVAIATIINCMRSVNAVHQEDVESRHDDILRIHSKGLPRLSRLHHIHEIKEGDDFVMQPGYSNFQFVKTGELLAHDKDGAIRSSLDGILLMPLYQPKGAEGFFIITQDPSFGVF